jgi:hypothetical protein
MLTVAWTNPRFGGPSASPSSARTMTMNIQSTASGDQRGSPVKPWIPGFAGHDGVYEPHHSQPSTLPKPPNRPACRSPLTVMLAEGEHPRLRRQTRVVQKAVDTRLSPGMTVFMSLITPNRPPCRSLPTVQLAEAPPRHACRRRASTTSTINAGPRLSRGYPPAAGMTVFMSLISPNRPACRSLPTVMLAEGEHPRLRRSTRVVQKAVDTRLRRA